MLEAACAERPELQDGWRSLAAVDRGFRGGTRGRPGRGEVPEWRLAAHPGPLRKFRIGAVFERPARRRCCGSKPARDWSGTRPSAVVGSGDGGKESVRCRAIQSHGLSHRQRLFLGMDGGRWGLFGDTQWCCVTASAPSEERASGGGAGIPPGRVVRDQSRRTHGIEGTRLQLMVGDC